MNDIVRHAHRLRRFAGTTRCAAVCAVALVAGGVAAAPAFPALQRVPLLDATLPGAPHVGTVESARIAFAPGQPSGPHRHPVPVVGVVNAGEFVFAAEGQPVRTLHTGDAFYEPAGVRILRFDNASQTAPATITAFYLADRPDRPLVEMLKPDAR